MSNTLRTPNPVWFATENASFWSTFRTRHVAEAIDHILQTLSQQHAAGYAGHAGPTAHAADGPWLGEESHDSHGARIAVSWWSEVVG